MKSFINTRLINAKPMTLGEYNKFKGWEIPKGEDPTIDGYLIDCGNRYTTWWPGAQFKKYCLEVEDNKNLPSGVSVGPKMVEDFIKEIHSETIGDKTTLVRVVLKNGFEIIESSSCVDKANYSESIGIEICLNKIKDKIWHLLGFLMQTAYKGVK